MKKWRVLCLVAVLLFVISGCSAPMDEPGSSNNTDNFYPTEEEVEETIPLLDSIEYWEIVRQEIVAMLNSHNLYVSTITHGYPCVQFLVEPGIVTDDGQIVVSGLSQAEYEELFECVKKDLHIILDKYQLAKPKTAFHGCHSIVDIFFNNWVIDENKINDNVYSRRVASYGVDLLEYYYNYEENSYIQREGFYPDVWSKYPVYAPEG